VQESTSSLGAPFSAAASFAASFRDGAAPRWEAAFSGSPASTHAVLAPDLDHLDAVPVVRVDTHRHDGEGVCAVGAAPFRHGYRRPVTLRSMEATGRMIDVQCDEQTLRVYPRTKAARCALTGAETRAVTGDGGRTRPEPHMGASDVMVLRASIAGVTLTRASMFGNGRIVVTTDDGSFRLNFRRSQQSAFETLALELGATVQA